MSGAPSVVIAGLEPAIHQLRSAALSLSMDARVEPAHDGGVWGAALRLTDVIPGRAQREPGIHNPCREYGFRVYAPGGAYPGMTNVRLSGVARAKAEIAQPEFIQ
ncbi:hypothetical protein [Rhodopseudomonas pseudopalustris]|uniref:Uncharacterized protein n=1 Tax=Rhodopseudomonas pseudopalustris TaxID=1513892 RepID=A0A1H8S9K4_9BRAD|nr:hypothetical protein [Rhodopseudomonas pseudopalustris]SEO74968.1 hypothetical protein SAMN05444123_104343 [Rhodopseudomonas pseudopalustris]